MRSFKKNPPPQKKGSARRNQPPPPSNLAAIVRSPYLRPIGDAPHTVGLSAGGGEEEEARAGGGNPSEAPSSCLEAGRLAEDESRSLSRHGQEEAQKMLSAQVLRRRRRRRTSEPRGASARRLPT